MDMRMKQENKLNTIEEMVLRFWNYIAKPFQITKVLELLYALNWIWYVILSLLPQRLVAGTVFNLLHNLTTTGLSSILLFIVASVSIYGLWNNIIRIRQIMLVFNVGVVLWIFFTNAIKLPISGGTGYLFILALLSMFALWRMDISDK